MFGKAPRCLGTLVLLAGLIPLSPAMAADTPVAAKLPQQEQRALEGQSAERVEAQIKDLHDKLKIDAAQEAKWKDVADAMRETAREMRDKLNARAERLKAARLTAVDELHAHQDLQQVRYDSVSRLIGPVERLYDTLAPEQKIKADALFQ